MVKVGRLLLAVAALCVSFGVGGISYAQDFYKGKTIHFIVGYSAGGSFDQYTRLIARHIGKHIPGNPSTVPIPGSASSCTGLPSRSKIRAFDLASDR